MTVAVEREALVRRTQRLKASTATLHKALEQSFDPRSWLVSQQTYRAVLERFYGYYAELEPRLHGALSHTALAPCLERRDKLPLLQRDLQILGCSAADLQTLPRCCALPRIGSPWGALGSLYVLEGSTLGGQLLCRMVWDSLGIGHDSGGAFFYSYGGSVGAMWRAFCTAVDAPLLSASEEHELVMAAQQTFRTLHAWLESRP